MIENGLGTPGENGLGTTGKKDLTIFEDTADLKAEDMAGVSTADLRWKQSNGLFGEASPSGHAFRFTGKVTMKVEPFPGVLLAVIVPPWRSAIFLQMASPMPSPRYSSFPWRRWKG